VAVITVHSQNCANRGKLHSDAAKRVSDAYRLHTTALGAAAAGRWMAVSLAEGTGDGVLYDSKTDAVRHQHGNESWFAYLVIGPWDMDVCEAEDYLAAVRLWAKAGIPLTDPREVVPRATVEDQRSLMRSIAGGGRTRPSGLIYPGE
jgi:hypothetical protein